MSECFAVEIKDHIAHIVLNRPDKRNSMNKAFWDELPSIVDEIDRNAEARVVVISSTGPHFTAGIDVSVFADDNDLLADAEDPTKEHQRSANFYDTVTRLQKSFSCLENCRIPVLAAIQGGCIGGGVDLVTACDMRYATENAFLTIFETNIGMTADVGTFPRLVKLIPEGLARELAYTGRRIGAKEAHSIGLINRTFPDQDSLIAGVMDIAREIASKAPMAIYGCKQIINYSRDHDTADSLDYIALWNASMLSKNEIREAMTANQEKRLPAFTALPKRTGSGL